MDRFPESGETVTTPNPDTGRSVAGGKGANQAVAAARLSSSGAAFVGQFGSDGHAQMLEDVLKVNNSRIRPFIRSLSSPFSPPKLLFSNYPNLHVSRMVSMLTAALAHHYRRGKGWCFSGVTALWPRWLWVAPTLLGRGMWWLPCLSLSIESGAAPSCSFSVR